MENNQINQAELDFTKIPNLNNSWKETFIAIKQYNNGDLFKTNESFKNLDKPGRWKIAQKAFPFVSILCAFLFGPFYYLFKGMWLKSLFYIVTAIVLALIFEVLNIPASLTNRIFTGLNTAFAVTAPINYYRLKILNTQW